MNEMPTLDHSFNSTTPFIAGFDTNLNKITGVLRDFWTNNYPSLVKFTYSNRESREEVYIRYLDYGQRRICDVQKLLGMCKTVATFYCHFAILVLKREWQRGESGDSRMCNHIAHIQQFLSNAKLTLGRGVEHTHNIG